MSEPVWPGLPISVGTCDSFTGLEEADQRNIETFAAWLIWALTGRQFGTESRTVRPVQPLPGRPTNRRTYDGGWPFLHGRTGVWGRAIELDGPVIAVTKVMVDGSLLDPANYKLLDSSTLIRVDGGHWPMSQDINQPDTAPRTFAVTFTRGRPLTGAGMVAAGMLACELAKAKAEDPTCALPDRVKTVVREGLSVQFLDPQEFIDQGRTGLTAVDEWITAVNPAKLASPAQAWSPDLPVNHQVRP